MARYYDIELSGTSINTPEAGAPPVSSGWTSFPNGQNDPGALQVELDILQAPFAAPGDGSTITIHGVALNDLFQSQQFTGMNIVVKGGMQAGLPLANRAQAGVLASGLVIQSFGNWVGTEMNLNFTLAASTYTFDTPGNFVFQWSPGQSLSQALQNMLNVAFPGVAFNPAIASTYATSNVLTHAVYTLRQVAQFIKSYTKSATSDGVEITVLGDGSILAYDGFNLKSPIQINFTDLIGQPRWVGQNAMQFQTAMRADIQVGSFVQMPLGLKNAPGTTQTVGNAYSSWLKYKTAFQGAFVINQVRHIGNFRDPDGSAWMTVFQCAPAAAGS